LLKLSLLATEYDNSLRKNTFTFALLYQRFGQTSEQEIYNNTTHGQEFEEFLEFLGRKVKLKDFDRYLLR
jgi:RAP1 GTPase activating protein 1